MPSSGAVSVKKPSPEERTTIFEPGLEREWSFMVGGAEYISVSLQEGALKEYVTLIDPDPDGGARELKARLKLPQEMEPGMHTVRISVGKVSKDSGMVGAVAGITFPLYVISLYPGTYIKYDFSASDTNMGEESRLKFDIESWGQENINILYGKADVFDPEGNNVGTAITEINSLASTEEKVLEANFSTDGLTLGIYTAKSTVFYDGNNKTGEQDSFRIGSPNIFINNWTQELYPDAINKFDIKIESDWGNSIEDVYGIITLKTDDGNLQSQTLNIDLEKFQKKTLEGYINTKDLDFGEYDVNLKVFYLDTNTEKDVKVNIVKGEIPEGQKYEGFTITLSTTTLLLIILILLVIGNISYFAYKIMKTKKKK